MADGCSVLRCVRFYSLVTYLLWFPSTFSDAAITWTQPSPPYTPSDASEVFVRTTIEDFLNGSAVQRLSWDFTLSVETLDKIFWIREKDNARLGFKRASGSTSIVPFENFLEHYNISSSDPATLIIYDVTEADEGLISCNVETEFGRVWRDIIKVRIVGPQTSTPIKPLGEPSSSTVVESPASLPSTSELWSESHIQDRCGVDGKRNKSAILNSSLFSDDEDTCSD